MDKTPETLAEEKYPTPSKPKRSDDFEGWIVYRQRIELQISFLSGYKSCQETEVKELVEALRELYLACQQNDYGLIGVAEAQAKAALTPYK